LLLPLLLAARKNEQMSWRVVY